MSDDLSEFHAIFFEEADELIETMEAELLELVSYPDDSERINTIFRAAHSIKGGSSTFGFGPIAEFTHVMETLLDEVREGQRHASQPLIDLLLKATDCVKSMIEAAKAGDTLATTETETVKNEMDRELTLDGEKGSQPDSSAPGDAALGMPSIWNILLRPSADSFKTANDPLPILTELSQLGTYSVECVVSDLPRLAQLDAELLSLAWQIQLETTSSEADIRSVFDWIDATSEIVLEKIDASDHENLVEKQPPPKSTEETGPEKPESKAKRPAQVSSIRVGIDKIDKLINLVGELVITQSMLTEEGSKLPHDVAEKFDEGLSQLQRYTRELQENVMQIRMVPISNAFNRLPRMIHDLSTKLSKEVQLTMSGEQTELDKTVLESIGDPLVHLVRNAVDHGIESPNERVEKGKPAAGRLELNAYHESGNIVIEIKDDGGGIDCERILEKARQKGLVDAKEQPSESAIYDLLFHPGFSTADQVSDVSGRGVGMDVVKRNILALGGMVEVDSTKDVGSVFTIRLPLTLAIVDGQLVRVGDQTYVIPLISIVESIQLDRDHISVIAERGIVYRLRDDYIPLVGVANLFSLNQSTNAEPLVVVVESELGKVGLLVDDLLAQQQVVIKSLEANYQRVEGVAGATILGDGTVALIIDVSGVIALSRTRSHAVLQAA